LVEISSASRRSQASAGPPGAPQPRSRGIVALVIIAVVLVAGFIFAIPYIPGVLKSLNLSTQSNSVTQTTSQAGSTSTTSSTASGCPTGTGSSTLVAPDIQGGSANLWYPSDYCALAQYALGLVNQDRATNGSAPVVLAWNQAAQQHADSMLYYSYFSHFDTQGYKPYMRYSLLGGRGDDTENVAYRNDPSGPYTTTSGVEGAIQLLEHSMMYDDLSCCQNGHRDNILNPQHNTVSIGVAYNGTAVFFDEEFENDYISLSLSVGAGCSSSNPGACSVTMSGAPTSSGVKADAAYVFFDPTPTGNTTTQLNNGPHEYTPGTNTGGVFPPCDSLLGSCNQFPGTTVYADAWSSCLTDGTCTSSNPVDVQFSLHDFVQAHGAGVYTVYLVTCSQTSCQYTVSGLTSISIFVP
jgi:uncharacterized protein YkwD